MRAPTPTDLVLASSSPRRVQLLRQLGLSFKTVSPDVDEGAKHRESPRRFAKRLAEEKAQAAVAKLAFTEPRRRKLVIAADTIVVTPDGRAILGKPIGATDAARMLKRTNGRTHSVFTAYCILDVRRRSDDKGEGEGTITRKHVRVVQSKVTMRKLSAAEIRWYVSTGEPMDKAGSYAAQGIGMSLIRSLRGSFSNVVGLPVCEVVEDLERIFGFRVLGK